MLAALSRLDALIAASRPAWIGLGQLGVTILGLHLAADRLDDGLVRVLELGVEPLNPLLERLNLATLGAADLLTPAVWIALATELLLVLYLWDSITLSPLQPSLSGRTWARAMSPHALILPLCWAPLSLAGAWAVGMAMEDGLAGVHAGLAAVAGPLTGALVAWRLSWTGWKRVVGGLTPPKHRWKGLLWAPPLLCMGGLAAWYGLPIRGFLPW